MAPVTSDPVATDASAVEKVEKTIKKKKAAGKEKYSCEYAPFKKRPFGSTDPVAPPAATTDPIANSTDNVSDLPTSMTTTDATPSDVVMADSKIEKNASTKKTSKKQKTASASVATAPIADAPDSSSSNVTMKGKKEKVEKEKVEKKEKSLKRGLTGYTIFCIEERKVLIEKAAEKPSMTEMSKACGEAWRTLAPEFRTLYNNAADQVKTAIDEATAGGNDIDVKGMKAEMASKIVYQISTMNGA